MWLHVALVLILGAGGAHAGGTVSTRVDTYTDEWIDVTVPAVAAEVQTERLSVSGGYKIDVLSGATRAMSVDMVSSATDFSDLRHQVDASLTGSIGTGRTLGGAYTMSRERDYESHAISANGGVDLFQRMSTATVAYGLAIERLGSVHDASLAERSTTHQLDLGWDQILTRRATARLLLTGATARCGELLGCLASPYRYVPLLDPTTGVAIAVHERNPDRILRGAAGARLGLAVGRATSIRGGYRFYADSWSIIGHTMDGALVQTMLDDRLMLRADGRVVLQSEAAFFQDEYSTDSSWTSVPALRTTDPELAGVSSQLVGGRAEWSLHGVGTLVRLGLTARVARIWYRYAHSSDLPTRNAWVTGGGINAEF